MSFLGGVTAVLVMAMLLSLYRVLRGPSVFDRLIGLGLIGTKTIVLLLLVGMLHGGVGPFADIALSYGLLGFVGSLALASYFEREEEA